jgi:serine protease AprX
MKRKASQPRSSQLKSQGKLRDGDNDLNAMIGRGVVPPVLHDPRRREELGLPADEKTPGRYMIELNILYRGGLHEAGKAFQKLCEEVLGSDCPKLTPISKSYFQALLSVNQWRALLKVDDDRAKHEPGRRVIYKLWPDFKVKALIDRSIATVKADAAFKSYSATGSGIAWAVVDSGIDGTHPHFGTRKDPENSAIYHPEVAELHYDFVDDGQEAAAPGDAAGVTPLTDDLETREQARLTRARQAALRDDLGHGTHVAGIIAGRLPGNAKRMNASDEPGGVRYAVFEQVFEADSQGKRIWGKLPVERKVRHSEALHGVAPDCLLVSLKVLDKNGDGRVSDVMRALVYVRENLNAEPKLLRIHGVNLSVGYDFDAQMFACGQSPLCVEVDRLVRSGVVVVTAAGNTGYGSVGADERGTKTGLSNTINDPGNAALAITVGSTHRDSPHTFGVSYFSSKGPTGDGRLKPDLVAPGERITSSVARAKREQLGIQVDDDVAVYIDDSGTSFAAPHVSGAIAAFLSIRREFIQRPEDVKRIFLESATSLGRERYFEGHGLVDLMRAIQSV